MQSDISMRCLYTHTSEVDTYTVLLDKERASLEWLSLHVDSRMYSQ